MHVQIKVEENLNYLVSNYYKENNKITFRLAELSRLNFLS